MSELDKAFARYQAAMNLAWLRMYESLGFTPAIVRWMPRKVR